MFGMGLISPLMMAVKAANEKMICCNNCVTIGYLYIRADYSNVTWHFIPQVSD